MCVWGGGCKATASASCRSGRLELCVSAGAPSPQRLVNAEATKASAECCYDAVVGAGGGRSEECGLRAAPAQASVRASHPSLTETSGEPSPIPVAVLRYGSPSPFVATRALSLQVV